MHRLRFRPPWLTYKHTHTHASTHRQTAFHQPKCTRPFTNCRRLTYRMKSTTGCETTFKDIRIARISTVMCQHSLKNERQCFKAQTSALRHYVITAADLRTLHPENKLLKYADDTYLIVPGVVSHTVEEELNHITDWSRAKNLRLNQSPRR